MKRRGLLFGVVACLLSGQVRAGDMFESSQAKRDEILARLTRREDYVRVASLSKLGVLNMPLFQVFPLGGGGGGITSGTTIISGGSDTSVCFNDAGVINCGNSGFTFTKTTGPVVINNNSSSVYALHIYNANASGQARIAFRDTTGAGNRGFIAFDNVSGDFFLGSAISNRTVLFTNSLARITLAAATYTTYFGDNDFSATPQAATVSCTNSRGGTDTNTAGANCTALSGLGTGTAAVSEYIFQTGVVQASGTTQHTTTNAAKITAGGFQNTKGDSFVTADVTNATTTFAAVTGLTATLVNGRKYHFEMVLFASESTAADGAKLDFNGGSATMTNFIATCVLTNAVGATLTQTAATTAALGTVINIGAFTDTNVHQYRCAGSIEPSAAGTFIPRQAQNAHTTGTLTTKRGGYLSVWDSP